MLLTLSANSLRSLLVKGRSAKPKLDLLDLPQVAREELGLHGLTLSTELLAGQPRERYDRLRERADKVGCACLLLVEHEPQPLGDPADAQGLAAVERLVRVIQAGSILGCNAVAVRASGADDPAVFARTVERLKRAMERADKLEMNVLIWPGMGLTSTADRVTELIKKVGGFRVGTLPDFETAAANTDPVAYLRRLTPYASSVLASTKAFTGPEGQKITTDDNIEPSAIRHTPYELKRLIDAILSVGYDASLAIEYRGTGDAKLGVECSRLLIEALLDLDDTDESHELDGEFDDEDDAEDTADTAEDDQSED